MLQELLDRTLRMSIELIVIAHVNAQQKAYTAYRSPKPDKFGNPFCGGQPLR